MRALEFFAEVDDQRRVQLTLPPAVPPGQVRVLVLLPEDEEDASNAWEQGVAREWADELADERQDIYTINDGEPIHAAR
jgi:hypothetical protein